MKKIKKKCLHHSKHNVLWWCPCVKKVPDFWKRITKIAWLVGIESSFTSLGRLSIIQTKEKFGSIRVYYGSGSRFWGQCDQVEEGTCEVYEKGKRRKQPNQVNKYIFKAMERQRRLNPDIAHYIYEFAPYKCDCKTDFWCKKYSYINPLQKLWDKIITRCLVLFGRNSSRWNMLKGGFVLSGRQWGNGFWQKAKRSFRKPF